MMFRQVSGCRQRAALGSESVTLLAKVRKPGGCRTSELLERTEGAELVWRK